MSYSEISIEHGSFWSVTTVCKLRFVTKFHCKTCQFREPRTTKYYGINEATGCRAGELGGPVR